LGISTQENHIPFGHLLIDSGADIVFGHSCHVFQGIEIYRGRPILYSTGDFIDDYAADGIERNDESFIFLIEICDTKTFQSGFIQLSSAIFRQGWQKRTRQKRWRIFAKSLTHQPYGMKRKVTLRFHDKEIG